MSNNALVVRTEYSGPLLFGIYKSDPRQRSRGAKDVKEALDTHGFHLTPGVYSAYATAISIRRYLCREGTVFHPNRSLSWTPLNQWFVLEVCC